MSDKRAWSVGVLTQSPHGTGLTSIFVLAESRAEAIAAGVRYAVDHTICPHNDRDCQISVAMTQATLVERDVIFSAAVELGIDDRERSAAQSDP